ncbi:unnamed protein product [Aureobasidium vineae]|uniref:Uncharacterized protein n=1 Tax=Aureobasidium vineae TaxID=2773715 RepID=A0A9N8JTS7_9PEZI|nr:unnamed protein product [Aureobasidium vineae]
MRFAIFIFISTSLALLIPRCDEGYAGSNNFDTSPVATATQTVSESRYPYTKKIKTTPTKTPSTTPLATRAVTTDIDESETGEVSTSSCTPSSICVDMINSCGHRYGGCYDQNFCDGNTSPYPVPPACPTMTTVKRAAAAPPAITPA